MLGEIGDHRLPPQLYSLQRNRHGFGIAMLKADLCRPDTKLALTLDQMHTVFVHVKRSIPRMLTGHVGHLPGAPDPASIVDVGISNHR
jgi:hypothetical protein